MTLATPTLGYYRFPTIDQDTIIFTAEGDLWKVASAGGIAQRLTTHHSCEFAASVSPDGVWLAFSAQYEGPTEIYIMPLAGGSPTRLTYEGGRATVVGWTPSGRILYNTNYYSTLPNTQLVMLDPLDFTQTRIPLNEASEGSFAADGVTLFFTRLPFQGSHAKRYQGGTVQNIWKFTLPSPGSAETNEALPLTSAYPGTSKNPMWWANRVYFISDRDGTMNLWSMDEAGENLRQHTDHKGWDIQSAALAQGRIVYQLGADLRLFDLTTNEDRLISITLASDFDQRRDRWIKNPLNYLNSLHLSPTGDQVVLTTRGRIFVMPARQGRQVEVTRQQGVRYRHARFLPDGKNLLVLSDESGELEFWRTPANGIGTPAQLTADGQVYRFEGIPSPDGQWLAYTDKNLQLWLFSLANKTTRQIAVSNQGHFDDLCWSPDSQWLAYVADADNGYPQIRLYHVARQITLTATSERVDSYSPAWSSDGKWLYFLSDRQFHSLVPSPWGQRQPEPYFDKTTQIYMLALLKGLRWPFQPTDELYQAAATPVPEEKGAVAAGPSVGETDPALSAGQGESANPLPALNLDPEGLATRLFELPLAASNYKQLTANHKYLFWLEFEAGWENSARLVALEIKNQHITPVTLLSGVRSYELSLDGKKLLVRLQRNNTLYIIDAVAEVPKELDKCWVNLNNWRFAIDPQEEWRQILVDAWRLARDYFYDANLHGLDWRGLLDKHLPLVARVTDRDELNNLIAQMVSELSALHTSVQAGDLRTGQDWIEAADLGAILVRDPSAGGYRISSIYQSDPDYPDKRAPFAKPDSQIQVGDIIEAINGVPTLAVPHPAILLQNQADHQVLLRVRASTTQQVGDHIVKPISPQRAADLRYDAWEYATRLQVETLGEGQIGYVHLRAMGGENYSEWVRDYYPIFQRSGLIIDVRNNRGGNIDSWILEKLLRKAWFFWQSRVGRPHWSMQYAFRGHLVVLCNAWTMSDGEAFAEGFRRLGLGKVIGTRTWGGAIWGSRHRDNQLVDGGYAYAAQMGMYSPDGEWLIEGQGVEPDIVVDNLPHATFLGQDAQLETAIRYLQEAIQRQPVPVPPTPPYPNKVFSYE